MRITADTPLIGVAQRSLEGVLDIVWKLEQDREAAENVVARASLSAFNLWLRVSVCDQLSSAVRLVSSFGNTVNLIGLPFDGHALEGRRQSFKGKKAAPDRAAITHFHNYVCCLVRNDLAPTRVSSRHEFEFWSGDHGLSPELNSGMLGVLDVLLEKRTVASLGELRDWVAASGMDNFEGLNLARLLRYCELKGCLPYQPAV